MRRCFAEHPAVCSLRDALATSHRNVCRTEMVRGGASGCMHACFATTMHEFGPLRKRTVSRQHAGDLHVVRVGAGRVRRVQARRLGLQGCGQG